VRSLSGVGEIVAALVGRSSISQLLSEGDLLRESVASDLLKIQGPMLPPLYQRRQRCCLRLLIGLYLSACVAAGFRLTVHSQPAAVAVPAFSCIHLAGACATGTGLERCF
jgi:hypothetical protein